MNESGVVDHSYAMIEKRLESGTESDTGGCATAKMWHHFFIKKKEKAVYVNDKIYIDSKFLIFLLEFMFVDSTTPAKSEIYSGSCSFLSTLQRKIRRFPLELFPKIRQ